MKYDAITFLNQYVMKCGCGKRYMVYYVINEQYKAYKGADNRPCKECLEKYLKDPEYVSARDYVFHFFNEGNAAALLPMFELAWDKDPADWDIPALVCTARHIHFH